ncbi:MAG: helix-turn-helix domain-containing protein [bacterium]
MDLFQSNKIYLDGETASEQLRRARQEKKLKLFQIAKKLNIKEEYLSYLEKGEYGKLPQGVYGKNFLREYAFFLGLNYKKLAEDYESEISASEFKNQKELFSKQVVKKRYLLATPRIFKNILIFLIICVFFVYLGYKINKIISPPILIISNPAADFTTDQNSLLIIGQTQAEAGLTINGQTILTDKNGNFSQEIRLKNGINIITITASKKYGRGNTAIRHVLVKEQSPLLLPEN